MRSTLLPARRRTEIAALAVGSLLLSGLTGLASATPVQAVESTNSDTSDHLLAAGRLTQADGEPAAGVPVQVMAWPSKETLTQMPVGGEAEMVEVASGVSDEDGSYSLRATNLAALAPNLDSTQLVDLQLLAGDSGHEASFSFSRRLVGTAGRMTIADPAHGGALLRQPSNGVSTSGDDAGGESGSAPVPDEPVTASLTLGTGEDPGAGSTPGDGEAITDVGTTDVGTTDVGATDGGLEKAPGGGCVVSKVKNLGDKAVTVGGTYSFTSGVEHWFTYERGATSSLGAGLSLSGAFGSFKASGTFSQDSTGGFDFPRFHNSQKLYKMYFKYSTFSQSCTYRATQYIARVTDYVGAGFYASAGTAPTAPGCRRLQHGVTMHDSSSEASKFTAELNSAIGIDLTAETGYSTKAEVNYLAPSHDHTLCGWTNHKVYVAIA